MTRYVALLRGIMPTNPNMKGEKLKGVFGSLGFQNVSTVIASGNVVFDHTSEDKRSMEKRVESELSKQLGFTSTTIIRSHKEIKALVKSAPFKKVKDEKPNYLVVTFFKDESPALCTVIDSSNGKATSSFMRLLEKERGKDITTRTWKTVLRVLKRMDTEL